MTIQIHQRYVLVVVSLLLASQPASTGEAETRLRSIKSRLPFIPTTDFFYRREPRDFTRDKDSVAAAHRALMELESPKLQVAELVELTRHTDPDIRALAVLGLVAQESREVVPACIRLLDDDAKTLPLKTDYHDGFGANARVATEPQKIADITRRILGMVGCPEPNHRRDVEAWWAKRNGNPDWLGWYEFLYRRASQGTSPVPATAKERIARFRKQVDSLPVMTRAWLLLYLADDVFVMDGEWHDHYATMDEMLDAARKLGPDALIAFLRDGHRQGLKPPDLDTKGNGQRFIVTNAIHLFGREHAPALLKIGRFTAAADADPIMVHRAVEAGKRRFIGDVSSWDLAKLMAALAVHGNAADRAEVAKWFYTVPNDTNGSSAQSIFIEDIKNRRPANWREIVKPLVAHSGFDQLKPLDVVYLALLVQKLGNASLKEAIDNYREDPSRLRNALRKMFDVTMVEPKRLASPKVVLSRPVWSVDLASQAHSLAVSDDGRWMAVGMKGSNPAVQVFDAHDGRPIHGFRQPCGSNFRVEFVSEKKLVFAPSLDNRTTSLWTWTVGEASDRIAPANPEVDRRTNSPPWIVPSRQDGRLALLDTSSLSWFANAKTAWQRDKRTRAFSVIEISPDAKWIAINDGFRKSIELIDSQNGNVAFTLEGLSTVPAKACFSPDSKRLLALGEDDRLLIWNTESGREVARYEGSHSRSGPIRFSADGSSFFAGAGWGHVGSFSTEYGSPQFAFPYRVTGTEFDGNYVASVVPSRDGRYLFAIVICSGKTLARVQKWALPRTTED
jgi:WD40 repeat protein